MKKKRGTGFTSFSFRLNSYLPENQIPAHGIENDEISPIQSDKQSDKQRCHFVCPPTARQTSVLPPATAGQGSPVLPPLPHATGGQSSPVRPTPAAGREPSDRTRYPSHRRAAPASSRQDLVNSERAAENEKRPGNPLRDFRAVSYRGRAGNASLRRPAFTA